MVQLSSSAIAPGHDGDMAAAGANGERRMHLVAYDYWARNFDNGTFPSADRVLKDGEDEFGEHAIIMALADDLESARLTYVGQQVLDECNLKQQPSDIADVPSRSILSRLTDHYMQTVANRAPVGFEAEFVNAADRLLLYRGILLPCSSNGENIDYVLGVINWKEGVSANGLNMLAHDASPLQTKKKKKTAEADPSPGQPAQERNTVEVAQQDNEMPKKLNVPERKITVSYETKLNECMEIDGAQAVALVDIASGMALATAGSPKGLNLEVAAAGNTNVMRAKMDTMRELGLNEEIEDVLITLGTAYHLIRPVTSESGKGLFVYLVLDKAKANLAMARFKLSKIEKELTV